MTRFKPRYVQDPGYVTPDDPTQPLYPSLGDYPSAAPFGGSNGPSTKFSPAQKSRKAKKPKQPAATKPPAPAQGAAAKPASRGHVATRTHVGGSTRASGRNVRLTLDVPYQIVEVAAGGKLYEQVLLSPLGSLAFGALGQVQSLGHHPQATGRARVGLGATHVGLVRRAVIVSYASGVALVQDADAPDSPPYSVAVSPAVTGAIGSASEAGLSLWDAGDPNDLLVSTVL